MSYVLEFLREKYLRRIYRPICEGAIWRSRYNEELYLYDETDLVTSIRITRLRWAGHTVQMQDNLPCNKITLNKPEGRRQVGRPNLGWMGGVTRVSERLGVRNWRIKAMDRDGGDFLSQPRPFMGCSIWVDGWMKMDTVWPLQILVPLCWTTWNHIPKDCNSHVLLSCIDFTFFAT